MSTIASHLRVLSLLLACAAGGQAPTPTPAVLQLQRQRVVILADTSASMRKSDVGNIRVGALQATLAILSLRANTEVEVWQFASSSTQVLPPTVLTAHSLPGVFAKVAPWPQEGGTEILPALRAVIAGADRDGAPLHGVILITDGEFGDSDTAGLVALAQDLSGRRARVAALGISESAQNALQRLADATDGVYAHLRPSTAPGALAWQRAVVDVAAGIARPDLVEAGDVQGHVTSNRLHSAGVLLAPAGEPLTDPRGRVLDGDKVPGTCVFEIAPFQIAMFTRGQDAREFEGTWSMPASVNGEFVGMFCSDLGFTLDPALPGPAAEDVLLLGMHLRQPGSLPPGAPSSGYVSHAEALPENGTGHGIDAAFDVTAADHVLRFLPIAAGRNHLVATITHPDLPGRVATARTVSDVAEPRFAYAVTTTTPDGLVIEQIPGALPSALPAGTTMAVRARLASSSADRIALNGRLQLASTTPVAMDAIASSGALDFGPVALAAGNNHLVLEITTTEISERGVVGADRRAERQTRKTLALTGIAPPPPPPPVPVEPLVALVTSEVQDASAGEPVAFTSVVALRGGASSERTELLKTALADGLPFVITQGDGRVLAAAGSPAAGVLPIDQQALIDGEQLRIRGRVDLSAGVGEPLTLTIRDGGDKFVVTPVTFRIAPAPLVLRCIQTRTGAELGAATGGRASVPTVGDDIVVQVVPVAMEAPLFASLPQPEVVVEPVSAVSGLPVFELRDGKFVTQGLVLTAPGDVRIAVQISVGQRRIRLATQLTVAALTVTLEPSCKVPAIVPDGFAVQVDFALQGQDMAALQARLPGVRAEFVLRDDSGQAISTCEWQPAGAAWNHQLRFPLRGHGRRILVQRLIVDGAVEEATVFDTTVLPLAARLEVAVLGSAGPGAPTEIPVASLPRRSSSWLPDSLRAMPSIRLSVRPEGFHATHYVAGALLGDREFAFADGRYVLDLDAATATAATRAGDELRLRLLPIGAAGGHGELRAAFLVGDLVVPALDWQRALVALLGLLLAASAVRWLLVWRASRGGDQIVVYEGGISYSQPLQRIGWFWPVLGIDVTRGVLRGAGLALPLAEGATPVRLVAIRRRFNGDVVATLLVEAHGMERGSRFRLGRAGQYVVDPDPLEIDGLSIRLEAGLRVDGPTESMEVSYVR